MKVAVVSIYPDKNYIHDNAISGVASYTKNLALNLPCQKDDRFCIITNKLHGRETYYEGELLISRCFDRNVFYVFQICRELFRIKPDVVHFQQELGLYGNMVTAWLLQWAVLYSRLTTKRTIITLHGVIDINNITPEFVHDNNSGLPVSLVKIAFKVMYKPLTVWAQTVIVHEKVFKDTLIQRYKVGAHKVDVIHHGVEEFHPMPKAVARKELGISPRRNVVLFMGYLTGYKGIDHLIEGFGEYLKIDSTALLILGAGKHPKLLNNSNYIKNEYHRLQQKATDLIPKDNFIWRGFLEETSLCSYYSAADVCVYPYTVAMSSSGPMSISIGYGTPFIASDAFKQIFDSAIIFQNSTRGLSRKLQDFFKDRKTFTRATDNLRSERLWKLIGEKTYAKYKGL